MKYLQLITYVSLSVLIFGCGTGSKEIILASPDFQERTLKYVVDKRPSSETDPVDVNILDSVSKIPMNRFRPDPIQIIDAKIEEKYSEVAKEQSLVIEHFEIVQVAEKSTGRAYASCLAGFCGWGTGLAADDRAKQKSDYVKCWASGKIEKETFEVDYSENYFREPFKSSGASPDFLAKLYTVTNRCIELVVNEYSKFNDFDLWKISKNKKLSKLGIVHVRFEPAELLVKPVLGVPHVELLSRSTDLKVIFETDYWLYVETPTKNKGWIAKDWVAEDIDNNQLIQ